MAHVSEQKKKVVEEFTKLLNDYPIVGSVNMENLPAPQLQTMRSLLRKDVVIRMTKRRLMKIAIESIKDKKPGIEKLLDYMKTGMPALLFTKENPFKLYKKINKNKSPAPAKPGQIAPKDIEVKAGPTSFMPGPIIGELGQIGVKSGVENGKIKILNDTIVCREGEVIKENVASMLTRLGINPMEIGLDVTAIYEEGVIYTRKILAVDEDKYINDITTAAKWALNLSVEAVFPVKENVELFVTKAFTDAKGLAVEAGIYADGVMDAILAKANSQMIALKNELKI